MNLEENKDWQRIIENSKDDDYIKACVDVAREIMNLLSNDNTPLHFGYYPDKHTPYGLISIADKKVYGGITDFMAKRVAQLVIKFHDRGKEFQVIWEGDIKTNGIVKPVITTYTSIKN